MERYYGVAFHHIIEDKSNRGMGVIHKKFKTLKDARQYASHYKNANIYAIEWTDGEGEQPVCKLKNRSEIQKHQTEI